MEIFCHIVGLNNKIKKELNNFLSNKKFNILIIDLDEITQQIINSKKLIKLYNEYENLYENLYEKNNNAKNKKLIKDIEKKMNNYWKEQFNELLIKKCKNKLIENRNGKIILLGLNNHFKNNKIVVKIDTKLKFFVKVDLVSNAKSVIKNNLDEYRNDIISGLFPLDYLNINFLIKKRESLQKIFEKLNYQVKSLSTILKIIKSNLVYDVNKINNLYFASKKKINKKKIPISDGIVNAYTIPWMAALSCLESDKLIKGFKNNQGFIKQKDKNSFEILKTKCYLYEVKKKNFYHHQKGHNIKFISSNGTNIINNYYISDIYQYLIDNDVNLIK